MQFLGNMKIGSRLSLGFGVLILMLTLLGLTGMYQMSQANDYAHDLGDNWLPRVRKLAEISNELGADRRTVLRHVIERDASAKQEAETLINKRHQQVLPRMIKDYETMISSDEERRIFAAFQEHLARYHLLADKTLELSRAGESGFDATNQQDKTEAAPAFRVVIQALNKSVEFAGKSAADVATASTDSFNHSIYISVFAILAAVAVGVALALLVSRSIIRPLGVGLQLAEAVAAGDLRSNVKVNGRDQLADLLRALQNMNHRLVDMVGGVRRSSDNIATGSAEIAIGNSDLSTRTEQQASNLQETAASMEELSATVKNNAGLAQEANRLAGEATAAAENGGKVVGEVVSTMEDISASSRKISDIIGVIDGIAFQTNILALNAAVEAARAGEQGRGFAVVASEVRSLAQRSANAAKEIKGLISASVEKVESGTRLVGQAGQNMDGIVSQVRQVRNLIGEIAGASSEQSAGIQQVGQAVSQLDQVTQQNAALVEESAAAAASLQSQAQQLAELVSVFKLSDRDLPTTAVAPRQPAASAAARKPVALPPVKTARSAEEEESWAAF